MSPNIRQVQRSEPLAVGPLLGWYAVTSREEKVTGKIGFSKLPTEQMRAERIGPHVLDQQVRADRFGRESIRSIVCVGRLSERGKDPM
jgi:hypothetical protein